MAPVVGLTKGEIERLVNTKLFEFSFDCEQPTASSQVATYGVTLIALAVGLVLGALVTLRFGHKRTAESEGRTTGKSKLEKMVLLQRKRNEISKTTYGKPR